jgi:phosphonate transport system substrate-binding protein
MTIIQPRIFIAVVVFIAGTLFSSCQPNINETQIVTSDTQKTPLPEETLVLGDVSGDAAWTIEHFQPLANYLAENLSAMGITQGRVIVTKDLATMMDYLETGQVDIYFDSPFPALEVYEKIGAQPLVRRWKSGVSEYHSLIVAHKDSGITGLDDLSGKVIVFDHPASTSGYLLPKSHLVIHGFETIEVQETASEIPVDQIGYIFAFGEENQIIWLLNNKVSAAGISNGDFEDLSLEQRQQLTILAQTPNVPRHIALASPEMDSEMKESIVQLLLEIDSAPEGKEILELFEGTSQFDELPNGPEGMMQALKELFAPVR